MTKSRSDDSEVGGSSIGGNDDNAAPEHEVEIGSEVDYEYGAHLRKPEIPANARHYALDPNLSVLLGQLAVQYGGTISVRQNVLDKLFTDGWRGEAYLIRDEEDMETLVVVGYLEEP